jgi:Skp family chaperone for outer membrane proteins
MAVTAGAAALALMGYIGSGLWAQTTPPARPATPEPKTRVALLNLSYVIKYYKKFEGFQSELKEDLKTFETRAKGKMSLVEATTKHMQDPSTSSAQRDMDQKEIVKLKREIEDINNDAKSFIGVKSDTQIVQMYKEIQDAAQRYAVSHNFELVLHYNDALTTADYYSPTNLVRKLSGGALMPLYAAPGLDISMEVTQALNASFHPTAAAPTAPAGAPAAH